MFTGIVIDRGEIKHLRARDGLLSIQVRAPGMARELSVGDSVAVNGVCLTVVASSRRDFSVEAMGETLARSTLEDLRPGWAVNLELPARLQDRLGGHLVQGHVDGVARAVRVEEDAGAKRVWLSAPEDVLRYLVAKGSVTLDGVSLTVVEVGKTSFQVALIPHTLAATTLSRLGVGGKVNVEVDVIAKYVERLVDPGR